MKRKPTPAQIAARERFAEMARSGAFKRKAKKAAKTKLQPGDKGTYAGYPASVIRHYSGNMYEIRVPGGVTVVDAKDFLKTNPVRRKKTVSEKISQLTREGYPQRQAVAIALSEERAGKVKRNPIILVSDKPIVTKRKSNPAKYRDTARGLPENRVLYSVHLATQRPSIASGGMFTSKQNAMRVAQVIADSTGKTYAVSRLERK